MENGAWQKRERRLDDGTVERWEERELEDGRVEIRYAEGGKLSTWTSQPVEMRAS